MCASGLGHIRHSEVGLQGPQGLIINQLIRIYSPLITVNQRTLRSPYGRCIHLSLDTLLKAFFSIPGSQPAEAHLGWDFCFLCCAPLLTEPWGGFRRCLGALSLEEKAAVSEFPLVPWTRLSRNADLQQHHHVRGGEKWILSVLFPVIIAHCGGEKAERDLCRSRNLSVLTESTMRCMTGSGLGLMLMD